MRVLRECMSERNMITHTRIHKRKVGILPIISRTFIQIEIPKNEYKDKTELKG